MPSCPTFGSQTTRDIRFVKITQWSASLFYIKPLWSHCPIFCKHHWVKLFQSLLESSGVTAGGGAGGRVPLDTSHREISAVLPGKERQGKKGNSLFKTTEICFGYTKMGIFYREKAIYFTPGKRSGKKTLPPMKNIPVMPLLESMVRRFGYNILIDEIL